MQSIDKFDAGAFGLSGAEATIMDPQHRLVLEAAGEALAAAQSSGECPGMPFRSLP
jgi:acyl transferase domain-containing protein